MLTKTEQKKIAKLRREVIKSHKAWDRGEDYEHSLEIKEEYENLLTRLGWKGGDPVDTQLWEGKDSCVRQAAVLSGMYTPPKDLIASWVTDPWNGKKMRPKEVAPESWKDPKPIRTGKAAHQKKKRAPSLRDTLIQRHLICPQ